ncbi:MAG: hypothetical protein IJ026_01055 [Candidatus Methanomethylophilaceae archaeon]|nr:hypothetical protein [Candidatus Methanomethylophilaceae archaeon]
MIHLDVDGCSVDIVPVVNGLVSEAERIRDLMGDHESYGASLGIEGIQAIRNRANYDDPFEVSELDLVYAQHMSAFGQVEMPSPVMCAFVDMCRERGKNVIALDMNDEDFTEMYCNTVRTFDYVNEHRVAKKGLKRTFKKESPEGFALEWDEYVNSVKSYRMVSMKREEHIANQIRDVAKYRRDHLAVIEVERVDGVLSHLR